MSWKRFLEQETTEKVENEIEDEKAEDEAENTLDKWKKNNRKKKSKEDIKKEAKEEGESVAEEKKEEEKEGEMEESDLSAAERSKVVKDAKAGKDIGKPGKNFDEVAAQAAEKYGSEESGKKVAAAAMWKNLAKKKG